ncbi:MAG: PIN domain-containing protein [Candidatus Dojkabacteria bacterium]
MVLLETDVLVKFLRDDPDIAPQIEELLSCKAGIITPVQATELVSYTAPDEVAILWQFLSQIQMTDITSEDSFQAGKYLNQYGPHYSELTVIDCLVAAVAVTKDAEIFTLNPAHFPMTEVKLFNSGLSALKAKTKERLQNFDLEE